MCFRVGFIAHNLCCMCCTLSLFRTASSSQGINVVQEWLQQSNTVGCKFQCKLNKLFLCDNTPAVLSQDWCFSFLNYTCKVSIMLAGAAFEGGKWGDRPRPRSWEGLALQAYEFVKLYSPVNWKCWYMLHLKSFFKVKFRSVVLGCLLYRNCLHVTPKLNSCAKSRKLI